MVGTAGAQVDFDDSELEEFRIESNELLETGETHLLAIERGEEFLANYDAIFRVFHSLKGAAGMLGLDKLQNHMHHLENLLGQCKERGGITQPQVSYFLKGVDVANHLLKGQEAEFDYDHPPNGEDATLKPKARPDLRVVSEEEPEKKKESEGLVYAIDDEMEILEPLADILKTEGFEVQTFLEPDLFFAALKARTPDVVLSDMNMPKITGLEIVKKVRDIDPDLPVILVSGALTREVLVDALNNGVYAAIEKPIDPSAVIATALNASQKYQVFKLLNKAIDFVMFQFSDLEDFLVTQGKEDIRKTMKGEIENLLDKRRKLRVLQRQK